MSAEQCRSRTQKVCWALLVLTLGLLGAPPASAQIRPAGDPIVGSRLQRIIEMIPGSATDLPPSLAQSRDVYLLVTAGASYTDIQVLANPEVPPPAVARALSSSLMGTPLQGQIAEWSPGRYSAAQVSVHHSSFGAMRGFNIVPIAPLISGLRHAGLIPHLLLRVPRFAQTSLPPPSYGTRAFRWYDAPHLGGPSRVTVTARLTWISLARIAAYYLLIPVIGLLGLRLAAFLSERGTQDNTARRLLFRSVSAYAAAGALMAQVGGMVYLLRTPTPATLADLWFGSATTTVTVPFLVAGVIPLPLFLLLVRRQELRQFGSVPAPPAIPMSDEEKAVRKRVAQWSALPHLIGAVALGAVPFFITRTNPLYPYIHPVALFLPILGAGLVTKIFQKRLDGFTQKKLDDDLTWRARQLGQPLSVRMPDVFVEDSSRASHLAFASHQGHHITLSRKLRETFTPAETDFVLAHHLACMKRRSGGDKRWLKSLLPLPMLIPVFLVLSPHISPGAPTMATIILSPWFFPGLIGYFGLFLILTIVLAGNSIQHETDQDQNADRAALEVTGNLVAAESALAKIEMITPALATLRATGGFKSEIGGRAETVEMGRLLLRRAALQKTAQALRFASPPGTKPAVPERSPYSFPPDSLDTDNQITR